MERVAQTLLGMDQQGAARDVLAPPLRLGIADPLRHQLAAPFELFPTGGEVAGQQPGVSFAVMRFGEIGLAGRSGLVGGDRFIETPEILERKAEHIVSRGEIRRKTQGGTRGLGGFLIAVEFVQRQSQIEMIGGGISPESDGFPNRLDRLRPAPGLMGQNALTMQRGSVGNHPESLAGRERRR